VPGNAAFPATDIGVSALFSEVCGENLPELSKGQSFDSASVTVKEGFTKPKPHHTEATILSAMENAGAEDYITKMTNVRYDPKAKSKRWLRFIDEIMSGDTATARFLNDNPMEFQPQAKFFINTNHLPQGRTRHRLAQGVNGRCAFGETSLAGCFTV